MDDKFFDRKKFSLMVEQRALAPGIGYMDAIIELSTEFNIELEDLAPLITPSLKHKVEAEAISLNYMKGGNTLPL